MRCFINQSPLLLLLQKMIKTAIVPNSIGNSILKCIEKMGVFTNCIYSTAFTKSAIINLDICKNA